MDLIVGTLNLRYFSISAIETFLPPLSSPFLYMVTYSFRQNILSVNVCFSRNGSQARKHYQLAT